MSSSEIKVIDIGWKVFVSVPFLCCYYIVIYNAYAWQGHVVQLELPTPKTCHAYSLPLLLFFRNASSSPPKSQMCQRTLRTWCSGWSAVGNAGLARTASRILRNTPSSPASTGRTFAALKLPTFLMSALLLTPPTLMWMMMFWKTRSVFISPLHLPNNLCFSNLFVLWTVKRLWKEDYLKHRSIYYEDLNVGMHMNQAAVCVYTF